MYDLIEENFYDYELTEKWVRVDQNESELTWERIDFVPNKIQSKRKKCIEVSGGSRMISERGPGRWGRGGAGGSFWSNHRTNAMFSERHSWTNSVDPDQTPQNVASDQDLYRLPLIQQF